MKLARVVLLFTGISFLGYGLYCLLLPNMVGEFSGLDMGNASAITEVHAMYGGLQAGTGVFFLIAGLRRDMFSPALLAMALIMGGLALARSFGLVLHGATVYNQGALTYEALTTVFAVVALVRLRTVAAQASPA